jgi:hypothetical protein
MGLWPHEKNKIPHCRNRFYRNMPCLQPRCPRDHIVNFMSCKTVKTCACLIQGKTFGGIIEIYHACTWPKISHLSDMMLPYMYCPRVSKMSILICELKNVVFQVRIIVWVCEDIFTSSGKREFTSLLTV